MGKEARKQSALLIRKRIDSLTGKIPVILTGDFNAKPHEDPIKILLDSNKTLQLSDTRYLSQSPHYGPAGSFNAFQPQETSDEPIDFIFVKKGIIGRVNAITILRALTMLLLRIMLVIPL